MEESQEVVVIGAGAAGLGAAAELGRRGLKALILERSSVVGASWRARYEGLRLNNDRWSARLPRSPIPRRAGRWPAREEFVDYLDRPGGCVWRYLDIRQQQAYIVAGDEQALGGHR